MAGRNRGSPYDRGRALHPDRPLLRRRHLCHLLRHARALAAGSLRRVARRPQPRTRRHCRWTGDGQQAEHRAAAGAVCGLVGDSRSPRRSARRHLGAPRVVAGPPGRVRGVCGVGLPAVPTLRICRGVALGLAPCARVHQRADPTAGHPVGNARLAARHPVGGDRRLALSAGTDRPLGRGPRVRPGGAGGARPGGHGVVARADAPSGAAAGLGRAELPCLRRIRAQDHALLPPGLPGTGPGGSLDVCVGLDAARATARAGGLGRRRSARVRAGCDGVVGAGLRADLRSRPHAGRGVGLHLQPCPFGIGDCRGALGRRAAPAAGGAWPGSIHAPATAGLRTRRRGETHPSDPDTAPGRSGGAGQRPRRGHHPAHAAALSAHGSLLRSPGRRFAGLRPAGAVRIAAHARPLEH